MALYTDMRTLTATALDAGAINDAITNILTTRIGSLPGQPTFGSDIHEVLFNQLDHITTDIIKDKIQQALAVWEGRILVIDVVVNDVPEYNKIVAKINYEYTDKGLDINEQISVAFIK